MSEDKLISAIRHNIREQHSAHEARIEQMLQKHQQAISEMLKTQPQVGEPKQVGPTSSQGKSRCPERPSTFSPQASPRVFSAATLSSGAALRRAGSDLIDSPTASPRAQTERVRKVQTVGSSDNFTAQGSTGGILKKTNTASLASDPFTSSNSKENAAKKNLRIEWGPECENSAYSTEESPDPETMSPTPNSPRQTKVKNKFQGAVKKVLAESEDNGVPKIKKTLVRSESRKSAMHTMADVISNMQKGLKIETQKSGWSARSDTTRRARTQRWRSMGSRGTLVATNPEDLTPVQRVMDACSMIISTKQFDLAVAGLILSNAVVIGCQTEWSAANLGQKVPNIFRVFEVLFTVAFTVELGIRMAACGKRFFVASNERRWNLFDTTLVVSAWAEEILMAIAGDSMDADDGGSKKEFALIRALAILRLVRITRVIRVMQFSRDLRIMVYGIVNSLRSLAWAVVLLLLVMFIIGVVITQVVTDSILDGTLSEEQRSDELGHYATLLRSGYSLYKAISGGEDWGILAEPLISINPILGVLFSIYIAFAVFCVLNVVTGVFVENTSKIKDNDTDHMIMEELAERTRYLDEVRNLFYELDLSGQGKVDWTGFEQRVLDLRVQAYFRKIGLNVEAYNSQRLFSLLDSDEDGTINAEDFVIGCAQLRGNAQKLDITSLRHETKKNRRSMEVLSAQFERYKSNGDGPSSPRAGGSFIDPAAFKELTNLRSSVTACEKHLKTSQEREMDIQSTLQRLWTIFSQVAEEHARSNESCLRDLAANAGDTGSAPPDLKPEQRRVNSSRHVAYKREPISQSIGRWGGDEDTLESPLPPNLNLNMPRNQHGDQNHTSPGADSPSPSARSFRPKNKPLIQV